MDFVWKQGGLVAEGGVEVNRGSVEFLGNLLEGRDDFGLNDRFVNSPACFVNGDWEADVNDGFGGKISEVKDERFGVRNKLVLMHPVLRLRVVRSELDNDNVRAACGGVLELFGFPVGQVALFEERGAAASKIFCFEGFAEKFAEHFWVVVFLTFFDASAEGDTVTNACDDCLLRRFGGEQHGCDWQSECGDEERSKRVGGERQTFHFSEGFAVEGVAGAGSAGGCEDSARAVTVRNPTVSHAQVAASSLKDWSEVRPAEA